MTATALGRWPLWPPLRGLSPVGAWLVALSLGAWLVVATAAVRQGHVLYCGRPDLAQLSLRLDALVAGGVARSELRTWSLMICAMMLPVVIPMARFVHARSAWTRRGRSTALFVAGYLALWVTLGAAFVPVALVARAALDMLGLAWSGVLAAFGAAALFQLTGMKERALNRCHGTVPLRAYGHGADADALRFGAMHAWRCARVCWPAMAALAIGGHSLATMALVTLAIVRERRAFRPSGKEAACFLGLAGFAALLPFV